MAETMWLGLVGVLLWGAQRGTSQILFSALVADIVPNKIIGTGIGIFYIVLGVVSLLTGSISGWIATDSLRGVFIFGLIASSLASVVLTLVIYYNKNKERFKQA